MSASRLVMMLIWCVTAAQGAVGGSESTGDIAVDNGLVRLVLVKSGDGYAEHYYSRAENAWKMVLVSGSALRPDPALKSLRGVNLPTPAIVDIDRTPDATTVTLGAQSGVHRWEKVIKMNSGDPFVHVSITDSIAGTDSIEYLLSTYSFRPEGRVYADYKPLDFVYTPQLRPSADDIIADHAFRSPALMMQEGRVFASIIPDIHMIDGRNRVMKSSGDLQVEAAGDPFMSFGVMNWIRKKEHVFYSHNDSLAAEVMDTSVSYGYYLYMSATAPEKRGFEQVVRFMWERYGHPAFIAAGGPQAQPFSSYIHKAWYEYVPQIAMSTEYDGAHVTLLRQARLAWSNKLPPAADNDCWFNVWFNALRTAYGMYMYSQEAGDTALANQAVGVLTLALRAPQNQGIAPSIFFVDSAGGHWVADHAWGGISHGEYLPMFHNAWTAYWLLQWSDLVPERRDEILRYTEAFGEFLLKNQHASGVIPSWYDPVTVEPESTFRDENAETAGAALFLTELHSRTKDDRYLHASEKAMEYIFSAVLPERKWFDFETFFSCSRKPVGFFDTYTQQHPQNTLSMFMAAEACYALYRITGRPHYRETGASILDYLCLYQQVWSPLWLSRELFGGFGVQNTDGEWSDSRQGYFAITLMHYYELTQRREYFERGIAALRAMFSLFESPTSPRTAENYAHGSRDELAGVTGIHWGTGSSVVSIHLIRRQYGDAFINLRQGWGAGIDGCRFDSVMVEGNTIRFSLRDVVHSPRTVLVKFGEVPSDVYEVEMNGTLMGHYSKARLEEGIEVKL